MDHLLGLIVMDMAVVLFTNRFFKGYDFETEYGFATYWDTLSTLLTNTVKISTVPAPDRTNAKEILATVDNTTVEH